MNLFKYTLFLIQLALLSCTFAPGRKLAGLPVSERQNLLDSTQAQAVFDRARFFPNGTHLSICIIRGDSETYAGILHRNDSLIYIENRDSVFDIGSITKTFTGTMLARLIYEKKVNRNDPVAGA